MKQLIVFSTLVLVAALFGANNPDIAKGIKRSDKPNSPAQILSTGGPDDFGYTWIDSNEPGGPVFNWIEISGTGTDMLLEDDNHFWGIPFPFQFYGTNYDTIAAGSNGVVYFKDWYLGLGNISLPGYNGYDVDTLIAVFWTDLNADEVGAGKGYYQIIGNTLVVEWDSIPLYDEPAYFEKFEAILYGNGDIVMQYLEVAPDLGQYCTVGIEGSPVQPPLWALQYSYEQPVLHNGLAIKFDNPLGVFEGDVKTPEKYWLNVPTISNGRTEIKFSLPIATNVKLEIYDALGRSCKTILDNRLSAGAHNISVNLDLPAGIYFYSLNTDLNEQIVKKGLIVK